MLLVGNPVVLKMTGVPFPLVKWPFEALLVLLFGNPPVLKVSGMLVMLLTLPLVAFLVLRDGNLAVLRLGRSGQSLIRVIHRIHLVRLIH